MAKHKAGGSANNLKDSQAQRLGVKKFGGQTVVSGNIIVRQRGTKFRPGLGTQMGKDHTIFAVANGVVQFSKRKQRRFTGVLKKAQTVSVV